MDEIPEFVLETLRFYANGWGYLDGNKGMPDKGRRPCAEWHAARQSIPVMADFGERARQTLKKLEERPPCKCDSCGREGIMIRSGHNTLCSGCFSRQGLNEHHFYGSVWPTAEEPGEERA